MKLLQILINSYFHPQKALDEIANDNVNIGLIFALVRGLCLSLFFYLPFYLLKFEPITPAYLQIFNTPKYFLYAAIFWPIFGILSCIYLSGITHVLFRIFGYEINFNKIFNLNGLLNLSIGIVIIIFDWIMVLINCHTNAIVMGVSHIIIADLWGVILAFAYYKKQFGIPLWLTILSIILVRLLYIPIAIIFIRT